MYIHVHVCVFDRAAKDTDGSTLDLKRFLRVSTAPA